MIIDIIGTNIESLEEAFTEAKDISNQNTENPGALILLTDVDAAGTLSREHKKLKGVETLQIDRNRSASAAQGRIISAAWIMNIS